MMFTACPREQVAIERMEHHGGIHAFERPRFHQAHLAGSALFGRRPNQDDTAGQRLGLAREREKRADRSTRYQVVPAGVTDLG
jgi:hypothetical protein